jgi:hypothetical protein
LRQHCAPGPLPGFHRAPRPSSRRRRSAVVRILLDASEASPANGHSAGAPAGAPEALLKERDEALARCRALEAELSALRARLTAA